MKLKFRCKECRAKVRANTSRAGTAFDCPHCSTNQNFPAPLDACVVEWICACGTSSPPKTSACPDCSMPMNMGELIAEEATKELNSQPSSAIQPAQATPGTTPIPPDLRLADSVRIKFRCDCGQRIRISARPGQEDHECPRCWERHESPLPGDPRIREIFCSCENPVDLETPLCSQCQAPVLVPIHRPAESTSDLPLDSDSHQDPKVLPYATFLDSPAPTVDEGAPTVLRPADEPPKPAPADTKSRSKQSSPSHPSRVRRGHSSDQRRSLQKRPLFARTEVQLITVGLLFALVFFTWFTKVYVKKLERTDRHSEAAE